MPEDPRELDIPAIQAAFARVGISTAVMTPAELLKLYARLDAAAPI